MSDPGSLIWFVGLGAGIVVLGLAIAFASLRRRRRGVAHPNAAWEQAAAESGRDAVAKQPPSSS